MRILLVNPPPGELSMGLRDIACVEPLGLEIIGASVPQHEVRILDMQLDARLHAALSSFRPHVVGIAGGIAQTNVARQIAERTRAFDPSILTVVGGHHATLCPSDFASPAIDVVVLGEGVAPFRELMAAFEAGTSLAEVAGLALWSGDGLTFTRERPIPKTLDHQPLPDRTLTAAYRDQYFYLHESPVALVQTSVGCTFPCTFCSCRVFADRRHIPRPLEQIADDLAAIEEEFVIFCDDHSFLRPQRMDDLAQLLEERGIRKRYFAYSRLDCVLENPALFERWGRLGLEVVMAGVEAVDPAGLDFVDKRTDVGENERAIALLDSLGIGVSAGFVIMPDFTEADFARIDQYIASHKSIVMAELTPFTPLPGTPLYAELESELLTTDRELFDLFHFVLPTSLPTEQMYALMRRYTMRITVRMFLRLRMYRPQVLKRSHIPRLISGLVAGVSRLQNAHHSARPN